MIRLSVLKTKLREEEIFSKLVSRGRHAEIPYYFSVERYDLREGYVVFTRLDCAPAPVFKVGVAGNCLIISQKEVVLVKNWLSEWNIDFEVSQVKDFQTPAGAKRFLRKLREQALSQDERKLAEEKAKEAILKINETADRELIAQMG